MKFSTTLLAVAIATLAPNAFAQTADLDITGKILPGACSIDLGDGIVDLGSIHAKDLALDQQTVLPKAELPFTVICDAAMRYAIDAEDNTGGSASNQIGFGLGLTPNDEKIGHAVVEFSNTTADGGASYVTNSGDNGETWRYSGATNILKPDEIAGFNTTRLSTDGPSPIKMLQGTMGLLPRIARADTLTLSDEVPINGSITFELKYL